WKCPSFLRMAFRLWHLIQKESDLTWSEKLRLAPDVLSLFLLPDPDGMRFVWIVQRIQRRESRHQMWLELLHLEEKDFGTSRTPLHKLLGNLWRSYPPNSNIGTNLVCNNKG